MRQIYLDYNATTPVSHGVRNALLPYLDEHFGNPSSNHFLGRAAHAAIQKARQSVASLIGADPEEIVFTSGGTESNNLAILGVMLEKVPVFDGHMIISSVEHPATTEPAKYLQKFGIEISVVPTNEQGIVSPESVAREIRSDTRLVSIMHANNEIGTIQPIREIAEVCHARGIWMHTDAAQSIGKIRTNVKELGADLLSIAGHKVYAPKGVGALYIRRGVHLEPVVRGAGHEEGLRPGTENTPYLVGLGEAAAEAQKSIDAATDRLAELRDRLFRRLQTAIGDELTVNGHQAPRLPNTLSVNFPQVLGRDLLNAVPEICASTGSACHSGTTRLSATLQAIGLKPEIAQGTVRLSVGRYTAEDDVDRAADLLIDGWERIKK